MSRKWFERTVSAVAGVTGFVIAYGVLSWLTR